MISLLTGLLVEREPDRVVIDVGGVGYEVEIPLSTFYVLEATEDEVSIHTHLVVRDDAQLLYGFASREERTMFRALIKVNSVGPKLALGILSGLDFESFAAAVRNEDVKTLTAIPGVGKKSAAKVILELKDKLDELPLSGPVPASTIQVDVRADAESALIKLGYKPAEASLAISQIEEPAEDIESLIRQALKQLMRT